jgi:DNA-binding transcriptional MerR regulator
MCALEDRRYSISEVSEHLDLPVHLLRQWEAQVPQLRPKRDRANRRYYELKDIRVIQRIKQLVRNEKMTLQGASKRIRDETLGHTAPRTNDEALEIVDQIEEKARNLLHILDRYDDEKPQ